MLLVGPPGFADPDPAEQEKGTRNQRVMSRQRAIPADIPRLR